MNKRIILLPIALPGTGVASSKRSQCDSEIQKTTLKMKCGDFKRIAAGVFMMGAAEDSVAVCSYIRCNANLTNEKTGKVGVRVEFRDFQGRKVTISVPRSEIHDMRLFTNRLLDQGFCINDMGLAKQFLSELYLYEPPGSNVVIVSEPGWHSIVNDERKAFVVNGYTYIPEGAPCSIELDENVMTGFATKGDLTDWQINVALFCRRNSRLMLLLSAGLAGPLLDLLQHHNIGIHIHGPSGEGKTTGLRCVASLYGDANFKGSWSATANALQESATKSNDLVLTLDEIKQCKEKDVSAAVYDLANGVTKSRMGPDRKTESVTHFRTVIISNGEHSLQDHLHNSGCDISDGQHRRLPSIPLNRENRMFSNLHGHATHAEFAAKLSKNSATYYGTAGHVYIGQLVKDQERLRKTLPNEVCVIEKTLLSSINADEPTVLQRNVARSMAVIATAGELAISYGIFPWPKGDAILAAKFSYQAWSRYENKVAGERAPAFASLKQAFCDNQSRVVPISGYNQLNIFAIYSSVVDGSESFLVVPEYFERNLCCRFGKKAGIEALKKRNLLVLSMPRFGPTRQVTIPKRPELGKPRFYVIRKSILTAE